MVVNLIIFYFLWFLMLHDLRAEKKNGCMYGTDMKVSFADCSDLHLETFPKNLKTNIEGLYLSWNHIECLPNNTFEHHPSIQFLYLNHMSLLELEPRVFAPLSKLRILDLSKNPTLDVSNLYFPVSLKKLYLDGVKTIKTKLPISSLKELSYLSLSGCKLDNIPSFGGNMLSLEILNLTENKLENFKIDNLAFLCQLKKLYISNSSTFQNNCECLRLRSWMDSRKITGSHITCNSSNSDENCDLKPSPIFLGNFESCEKDVTIKKYLDWFIIGSAGLAICFSCILLYFCCNRKGFFCYVMCCYCCRKKRRYT